MAAAADRKRSMGMKLHQVKERLDAHKSDLSGSVFSDINMSGSTFENINLSGASIDDANMSGWRVSKVNLAGLKLANANLAGAAIADCRLDGMTIDGILVTDLLDAYRAARPSES
jgi:uncharacterized protein YjbI with pentapeptide repeats